MIENAKQNYLLKIGQTLANAGTSSKMYWSFISTVLNKAAFTLKACFCVHAFACINALLFALSRSD